MPQMSILKYLKMGSAAYLQIIVEISQIGICCVHYLEIYIYFCVMFYISKECHLYNIIRLEVYHSLWDVSLLKLTSISLRADDKSNQVVRNI